MKKTCVPKLRFAEFKDSGEWQEKKLGQLLKIGNGRDYKHLSKGDIPVYGTGGYMLSVDEYLYDGESVCIGRKGTIDKPFMLYGKFWNVDTLFYTHSFNKCTPKFIYACFQNINWYKYNSATGVPSLTKITIENIQLLIPTLPEQKKIADCLSSIDEIIDLQTQKLERLKQHKKGLMQKLFPKEDQTTPDWRFAEFRDSGWEKQELGHIFKITSTKRVHESEWQNEGIPFYRARELVSLAQGYKISPLYIDEELYIKNIKLSGEINKGDLLVTGVGSIGIPYLVKNNDKFYFKDGNIIWLKNDEKTILGKFLYLFYQSEYIQNQIKKITGIGTVATYTIDNARKTIISFPKIKEQQKIADCLSSIDELIELQTQKIENLKQHKKGLMQGLFPNPTEVI